MNSYKTLLTLLLISVKGFSLERGPLNISDSIPPWSTFSTVSPYLTFEQSCPTQWDEKKQVKIHENSQFPWIGIVQKKDIKEQSILKAISLTSKSDSVRMEVITSTPISSIDSKNYTNEIGHIEQRITGTYYYSTEKIKHVKDKNNLITNY